MTLIDNMSQEKKEEEDTPELKKASMDQNEDSKTTLKGAKNDRVHPPVIALTT